MLIQNVDRCYQVIQQLAGTQITEELLCKELTKQEDTACLLVRINDTVLAKNFILFLDEKVKGQEFSDYRECFHADGAFYVVFQYSLDQSLQERLQTEHCSLRERAQIVRSLLEHLLLLNPHPYFAWSSLHLDQITVSRSMEVKWNYHLEMEGQFDTYSMADVAQRLLSILSVLFQEEQQKHLYPLLDEYMNALAGNREMTYLELYQNFIQVYEALIKEPVEELLPKTLPFRIWDKLKKFFGVCKKILAVVILLAAVLYVIYAFQDNSGSKVMSKNIQQIGELIIK